MRLAAAAVILLLVGSSTGRAEPPPGSVATPAPITTNPVIAYYPPAALAARLAGDATLSCDRAEHGALTNCKLVKETPAGAGFGAAALALAAHAIEFPTLRVPIEDQGRVQVLFGFAPSPPMISPDVLSEPSWRTADVEWMGFVDERELAWAYPVAARGSHKTGFVGLLCALSSTGWLSVCQVVEETPPGYGFGQAALSVTHQIHLKSHGRTKGAPQPTTALFPIHFAPPVEQGRRTLENAW
ncbi:MAG TPA: hypothetical protein VGF50_03840 [Caulobacteraceae bacterium]